MKPDSNAYRYAGYLQDPICELMFVEPGYDFVRNSDSHHLNLQLPWERYEAFAYAVEAQSMALGTQAVGDEGGGRS